MSELCSSPLAAAHPLTVPSWPRRSTPVCSGVPAGWPQAAIPVLSLISRNSPKQLGMVSPELLTPRDRDQGKNMVPAGCRRWQGPEMARPGPFPFQIELDRIFSDSSGWPT